MSRLTTAFITLGLACLFTHELDAMTHAEWRLLFVLRDLPDEVASPWFVALHVPLFFAMLWFCYAERESVRFWARVGVAAFLVVHGLLHASLSSHDAYEFDGALSNALIGGAAFCGAVTLALLWRGARAPSEPWG